jgi:hypothetical protein
MDHEDNESSAFDRFRIIGRAPGPHVQEAAKGLCLFPDPGHIHRLDHPDRFFLSDPLPSFPVASICNGIHRPFDRYGLVTLNQDLYGKRTGDVPQFRLVSRGLGRHLCPDAVDIHCDEQTPFRSHGAFDHEHRVDHRNERKHHQKILYGKSEDRGAGNIFPPLQSLWKTRRQRGYLLQQMRQSIVTVGETKGQ